MKHSDYCDLKVQEEGGDDQSKWDCLEAEFGVEQTDLDCAEVMTTARGSAF